MAGMAIAAVVWAGASSGAVIGGLGVLFLLCALLSSSLATSLTSEVDPDLDDRL